MTVFTAQEKIVFQFLVVAALIGLIVGSIRHGLFNKKQLIISPTEIETFASTSRQISDIQKDDLETKESSTQQKIDVVNINTANKDELTSLPNVGSVTAERIIRFREDFGEFKSVEDLIRIKGIGPKTLEKIKPFISI